MNHTEKYTVSSSCVNSEHLSLVGAFILVFLYHVLYIFTEWASSRESVEVCVPAGRHHAFLTAEGSHTSKFATREHPGMWGLWMPACTT